MPVQWMVAPSRALDQLTEAYVASIRSGVLAIANRRAPEIEQYMRTHALWNDRTGDARKGLHTEVTQVAGQMVAIVLAHGVDYGIWLEVSNQGRFAIIAPSLDVWSVIIWRDVQALLR